MIFHSVFNLGHSEYSFLKVLDQRSAGYFCLCEKIAEASPNSSAPVLSSGNNSSISSSSESYSLGGGSWNLTVFFPFEVEDEAWSWGSVPADPVSLFTSGRVHLSVSGWVEVPPLVVTPLSHRFVGVGGFLSFNHMHSISSLLSSSNICNISSLSS